MKILLLALFLSSTALACPTLIGTYKNIEDSNSVNVEFTTNMNDNGDYSYEIQKLIYNADGKSYTLPGNNQYNYKATCPQKNILVLDSRNKETCFHRCIYRFRNTYNLQANGNIHVKVAYFNPFGTRTNQYEYNLTKISE